MNHERQDDLKIIERATEWLEIIDDAVPHERAAFIAWLKESPRHVGEFLAVAAISREFNHFDAERRIDIDALLAEGKSNVVPIGETEKKSIGPRESRSRPSLLSLAAASLIAAVAAGWLVFAHLAGQHYETAVGEQRSIELADGSVVFLNAHSKLAVHFSDRTRDLELLSGEALFKVARDPKRPFRVDVGSSLVQAVGTQFNIYRHPQSTMVSVLEGKVQLSNKTTASGSVVASTPVALQSGQEADIAADGRLSKITPVNEVKVMAWRQRQLVFRSDRLADVAVEFNRYNQSPKIHVEGEAASERKLTGIFDADDPESLVQFLSDSDLVVRQRQGEVVIEAETKEGSM